MYGFSRRKEPWIPQSEYRVGAILNFTLIVSFKSS
jgi:hypothetical protein